MTAWQPPADDQRCTATSKGTGERCRKAARPGAAVCVKHGAGAPQVRAAAAKAVALQQARAELERMGHPVDTDPAEALLATVADAAGAVAFLRAQVQALTPAPTDVSADDDGTTRSVPGVWGHDHQGDQATHVLVQLYGEWTDRLARCAALALKAGVDERRVRVAEHHALDLYGAFGRAVANVGLTGVQQEALRAALASELRSLAA